MNEYYNFGCFGLSKYCRSDASSPLLLVANYLFICTKASHLGLMIISKLKNAVKG